MLFVGDSSRSGVLIWMFGYIALTLELAEIP